MSESELQTYNNSKHNNMLSWAPGENSQTTHPDKKQHDVIFTNSTRYGTHPGRLVRWDLVRKGAKTDSGSIAIGEQLKVQNKSGDAYSFWAGDNGSPDNSIHCNMNG
jgi:hypothetical protein